MTRKEYRIQDALGTLPDRVFKCTLWADGRIAYRTEVIAKTRKEAIRIGWNKVPNWGVSYTARLSWTIRSLPHKKYTVNGVTVVRI